MSENEPPPTGEGALTPSNPDPPTPPTPPNPPDPITNSPEPSSGDDRIGKLESIVTGLVDVVSKLVPTDATPTKRPWTHIGSKQQ